MKQSRWQSVNNYLNSHPLASLFLTIPPLVIIFFAVVYHGLSKPFIHPHIKGELSPCVMLNMVLYNMYENESPNTPPVS